MFLQLTLRTRIATISFFITTLLATTLYTTQVTAAQGYTSEELKIKTLLDTVAQLQSQLDALLTNQFVFTRDLSIEDTGEDVRQLQKILNQDSRTMLSKTGVGSPGHETAYFGEKTLAAIIRYQLLHKEAIRFVSNPADTPGTVGLSTREFLNSPKNLTSSDEIMDIVGTFENKPTHSTKLTETGVGDGLIAISSISSQTAKRGDKVTLTGFGFTPTDNVLYFDEKRIFNDLDSITGKSIQFTIPKTIPLGLHTISVKNRDGASNNEFFIVIYEGTYTPPKVTSINPITGNYGEEVTITGSRFTETGNMLRASYGVITNLPSPDGNTITFNIRPEINGATLIDGIGTTREFPVEYHFYVVNNNGVSNNPVTFNGKI